MVVPANKSDKSEPEFDKPKQLCLIPFADVDEVKTESQLHSAVLRGIILSCVDELPADFAIMYLAENAVKEVDASSLSPSPFTRPTSQHPMHIFLSLIHI